MYEKCPECYGRKPLIQSFYFKVLVCRTCADKARSGDEVLINFHKDVVPIDNELQ